MHRVVCVAMLAILVTSAISAIEPGTEIVVPAAARAPGAGGSMWVTALYVMNPNATAVDVELQWLERDRPNPAPLSATRTIAAGAVLVLEDAAGDLFGISSGSGAFLITSTQAVVVNAGIFNRAGGQEYGQGFEGIPVSSAIAAGAVTHAVGVISNSDYRTNFYLADASGTASVVDVAVLATDGTVLASQSYELGLWEPILKNIQDVYSGTLDGAILRFTVQSGAALVGSSRINNDSGDPLTLSSWWDNGDSAEGSAAPDTLAGLDLELVVTPIECGLDPFTWDVEVEVLSDSEASIAMNGGDAMTIPVGSYSAGGAMGYLETSVPDWEITDIWLTMIWTSDGGGRFTGAATDYDGSPIKFSGTFAVVTR